MRYLLALFLICSSTFADTPAPGTVKANQGSAGAQAWPVTVSNLSLPVTGSFYQATQPVSLLSLPSLVAGTATIGNVNVNGTVPVSGTFWQATQPVSGTVAISGTVPVSGSITATNAANGTAGSAAPSTATLVGGSDGTNLRALKVSTTGVLSVDGSSVTQPVSASSLPLPAGAATSANQATEITTLGTLATSANQATEITTLGTLATSANQATEISTLGTLATSANQTTELSTLATIATAVGNVPAKGLSGVASSQPVALPLATSLVTAAYNSTTGVVNTDMLTGTVSGWYDAAGYTSFFADVYTTTTVTAGVITFEQTNDVTNDAAGITLNLQDTTVLTQTNVTSLTLAASTVKHYQAPITSRYIRFRISTAFAGTGTVGATLQLKQTPYVPLVTPIAQATAGSLNATIGSGTITTVSTVSSASLASAATTDIASAAITSTATSSGVSLTNVQNFQITIPVTVVSGTTPTMDVVIQESYDATNWTDIYHFERITATGVYISPVIRAMGQQIRYVRTIAGTTPSFTMSATRNNRASTGPLFRRIFDRSIAPNTLNSVSAVMFSEGCDEIEIVQSSSTGATTAPVIALEGSEDNTNFYAIGNTAGAISLTGNAGTNSASFVGALPKFTRARISTAGVGAALNYVALKCKGG